MNGYKLFKLNTPRFVNETLIVIMDNGADKYGDFGDYGGTVIVSTMKDYPIGHFSGGWNMDFFEEFKDSVTLKKRSSNTNIIFRKSDTGDIIVENLKHSKRSFIGRLDHTNSENDINTFIDIMDWSEPLETITFRKYDDIFIKGKKHYKSVIKFN